MQKELDLHTEEVIRSKGPFLEVTGYDYFRYRKQVALGGLGICPTTPDELLSVLGTKAKLKPFLSPLGFVPLGRMKPMQAEQVEQSRQQPWGLSSTFLNGPSSYSSTWEAVYIPRQT